MTTAYECQMQASESTVSNTKTVIKGLIGSAASFLGIILPTMEQMKGWVQLLSAMGALVVVFFTIRNLYLTGERKRLDLARAKWKFSEEIGKHRPPDEMTPDPGD